jgi:hypothetical protein
MTAFAGLRIGDIIKPMPGAKNLAAFAKIKERQPFMIRLDEGRYPPRHRMFFATIKTLYESWPELHEFQPDSADHLRHWLLVKANYRDIMDLSDPTPMALALFAAFARGRPVWVKEHKGRIIAFAAKSQAFKSCTEEQMKSLVNTIFEIIETETGIDASKLKKEPEQT